MSFPHISDFSNRSSFLTRNHSSTSPGTFAILPTLIPPVPGIGVYFGRDIASPLIFFPISSNGANAVSATLLTPFAAINATHIKIIAIISTIRVPKSPQAEDITHTPPFAADATSVAVATCPLNSNTIPQKWNSYTLLNEAHSGTAFLTILLAGFPISPESSHQVGDLASVSVQGAVGVSELAPRFGE